MSLNRFVNDLPLAAFDPELAAALAGECDRQERFLELIASENYVSPRVLRVLGSELTNKYADGVPGRRMYSGCEQVDKAESLAIDRACRLFGAGYANVQAYSGTQANAAVYHALLKPGQTLLGMRSGDGGHVTHGAAGSFSASHYSVVQYGIDANTGDVDFDEVETLAQRHQPTVIVAGFSAYAQTMDWQRFRQIADRVGALFVADMAHVAGLVAAGLYPNPVPIADVVTTTTHKTLRGPRGGMILVRDADRFAKALDDAVYPGVQGGPLMNVVAAKAVAFAEAATPEFRFYQQAVLANARRLAATLQARQLPLWSGSTENHMLLIDMAEYGVDARKAEQALEDAGIAVNCMALPGGRAAGLRLGTPAVTTRGLREAEMMALGEGVADVLEALEAPDVRADVAGKTADMARRFPVYRR